MYIVASNKIKEITERMRTATINPAFPPFLSSPSSASASASTVPAVVDSAVVVPSASAVVVPSAVVVSLSGLRRD